MDAEGVILLDVVPGPDGEFDRSFLERVGHRVVVCHGPAHKQLCPILAGAGCVKAEGAHGIVFALDLDRAQHRAILRRYVETTREDVPIRVVVKPGQEERFANLLRDVEVWVGEPNVAELDGFAAEVESADRFT
ncbi:MAG: hypothetical protein M5U14_05460 [Acidimicrobiia bacterium]|nr:hypothetical protein [Acidimicrobiia bacterium]